MASQLMYPIVLSTLLAGMLFAGRVLKSRSFTYDNLIWNLFLAWIPYLCSLWAVFLFQRYSQRWWLLIIPGGIWLIFFPNAPYMITDFLHLETRPFVPLWYDIILLATFAWTGCFLAITSLRTMQSLVNRYLGKVVSWLFASYALAMGGLGIYLGRFSRWNSWDLFIQPKAIILEVLRRVANPLQNLRFFGFTLLFTLFLFICYITFISVRQASISSSETERH